MVKPKKSAKSEPVEAAVENGAVADQTSAIEEGKLLDYITGKPVAENDKERVRQRIARAMFHEYGISVNDMEPDFRVKVDVIRGAAGNETRSRGTRTISGLRAERMRF